MKNEFTVYNIQLSNMLEMLECAVAELEEIDTRNLKFEDIKKYSHVQTLVDILRIKINYVLEN